MGKTLDWVREEATGRLIFRRRYAGDVRPFLPRPNQLELKVPLEAKRVMTPQAFRVYHQAIQRFEREVRQARAARQRHEKALKRLKGALSPERVEYLTASEH